MDAGAAIAAALASDDRGLLPEWTALRPAEAADRLALHVARCVERALRSLPDDARVASGVRIARAVLARLQELTGDADAGRDAPVDPGTCGRCAARGLTERRTRSPIRRRRRSTRRC